MSDENKLKEEILQICDELEILDSSNFSWQYVKELYRSGEKKIATANSDATTKKDMEASIVYTVAVEVIYKFIEVVNMGEKIPPQYQPSESDIDFFQEISEQVSKKVIGLLEEGTKKSEVEKRNKDLKKWIQEEKRNRKNKISTNQQDEQENSTQNNQQVQELKKEIELLTQQLAELQKQMGEILELLKKSQSSNEPDTNKQELQKKLETVQSKQQQVQKQLEEKKQVQTKILINKKPAEPEKEKTQSQAQTQSQNDKGFNWLYVIIPGGVVLLVGAGIIFYVKKIRKN